MVEEAKPIELTDEELEKSNPVIVEVQDDVEDTKEEK